MYYKFRVTRSFWLIKTKTAPIIIAIKAPANKLAIKFPNEGVIVVISCYENDKYKNTIAIVVTKNSTITNIV